jgi:hypothetical protein
MKVYEFPKRLLTGASVMCYSKCAALSELALIESNNLYTLPSHAD